jgi:hypothetical protein
VRTLYEQGFVVDAREDRTHSLTAAECKAYANEITFVRYALDSAEYRFQYYREARVTMLGSGPVLAALLDAGLHRGCGISALPAAGGHSWSSGYGRPVGTLTSM